jgi:arylsulfatase A-like enzyme/tetratricopeptide (TPR) repeat protein
VYRFCVVFLLLFAGFASAAKPDVLLITIDTLRSDHLGCYGNKSVRTPNLDRLAANALFFENAVCQAPLTLPSHTSLLTGRYPYHHGVHDNAGSVPAAEATLAEMLKRHGYHTYAFVGGFPLDHRFGLNQGFDVYDDFFPREKNRPLDFRSERPADRVVDAVRQNKLASPFFLWVHFYDPHAPYLHGGYNGEIEFVDQQVGLLLNKIPRNNLLIAVAGDHGESLGEHGEYTHRIFIYDSTVRVPFWISGPGILAQKVKPQVRLIDFVPTILRLLDLSVPPNIDGAGLPSNSGKPAYLESMFGNLQLGWSPLKGIRDGQWKLIEAPHPELYDIKSDPGERQNLYTQKPDIVKQLRAQVPGSVNTAPEAPISPEMAERLASLGYVSGSGGAKVSHIDPKDRIAVWNQIEKAVDLESADPTEAIRILQEARKADPDNPMVLGFLAQKYGEAGRIPEATGILQSILKRDPKNTLALYRLSVLSIRADRPDEAKEYAETLRKIDTHSADAFTLLARANLKLGRTGEAAQNLKQALAIDPGDLEVRNDLANLYAQEKKPDLAELEFQSVLKRDPRNIQALNGLATCVFMRNDFKNSESYLKSAIAIDPSDAQTKMNLALLYSSTGRKTRAIELYREISASDSTPPDWKTEAQKRLRELNEQRQ